MDAGLKHKRETNPGQNAKLLSKITFYFVLSMFRRSSKNSFKDEDVYDTMKEFSTKPLGDKLEAQWNTEQKKHNPNIIRALFLVFRKEYVFWGVLYLAVVVSGMIAQPILIGKLVAYFAPNQTKITKELALMYAVLLIGCIFANSVFSHTYAFIMKLLGLKIKIACTSMIYRKILKLGTFQVTNAITGQAVTLISKDLMIFEQVLHMFHQLLTGMVQILVMTIIIYFQIGNSAFVGLLLIILIVGIQAFCGHKTMKYRLTTAQKTDERLQITQEIISTIRNIKMFTLEQFFSKSVDKLRRDEIRNFQITTYLAIFGMSLGILCKKLALYSCVVTFVALGNQITAEKAFVVTGCFNQLQIVLQIFIPICFLKIAELKAMAKRANNFLLNSEVLGNNITKQTNTKKAGIILKNVTVNIKNQAIIKNLNASLQSGSTIVLGTIGCGKSLLLKAILGDIPISGTIEISGKISYASQEPWLFPGTIKQNIVFNDTFDQARYDKVVQVCALRRDLDMLSFGDQTILSDKGLNLSHGQKTRINLARAVYQKADIYLLDDCLSAVDLKVARHIFFECLKDFLKEKVCVLVSHSNFFLNNAGSILLISKDGASFQGTYEELEKSNIATVSEKQIVTYFSEKEELEKTEECFIQGCKEMVQTKDNIYKEAKEQGAVKKTVYLKYVVAGGTKLFLFVLACFITKQGMETWSDYFIRFWVDSEQRVSTIKQEYSINSTEYATAQQAYNNIMSQYSIVIFVSAALVFFSVFIVYVFGGRASVNIHRQIMKNILNAEMTFYDKNLPGNIINRFSRDFSIFDEQLPFSIFQCLWVFLSLLAILLVVSIVNSWFLIPSAIFAIILYIGRSLYLPAGRNIRRIEGSTRSPVIGHMQATFEGLTTIKAAEAQTKVNEEFENYLDVYNSAMYMHNATVEAFSFYMDILTTIYIAIVIFTIVLFGNDIGAGNAGLAITQSLTLITLLQWGVLQWSELEIRMTSAERILEYLHIKPENKSGESIDNWPQNGTLVYQNVSLRYSKDMKLVLKNINFTIESGEKIGIVGRTGAGKSSIISALFRLYEFDGSISIDGADIKSLNIDFLRSKISIVPQDPTLFAGTIRSNLDPKVLHTDQEIWHALEKVEMKGAIRNLNLPVKENSTNFSIGEKQLLCLVRIILESNKVLVFDEATANVDAKTESLIQRIIEDTFVNGSVIIIAHRLHTILKCNKVLVMDAGNVVEYGHPDSLLSKMKGVFYDMVNGSGLVN